MATAINPLAGVGGTGNNSLNTLLGLGNLLQQITGSSSTTKQSSSTQSNISDAGIQSMIQQVLQGAGGIKDISGAARSSGVYNSSTELQQTNDLETRLAGELAQKQAGTTTSTNATTSTPGLGIGALAIPLAGTLLKPVLSSVLGIGGNSSTTGAASGGGILGALGLGGNASTTATGIAPAAIGSITAPAGSTLASLGGQAAGIGGGITGDLGGLAPTSSASLGSSLIDGSGAGGDLAGEFGMTAAAGGASDAVGAGASSVGMQALPGYGGLVSGFLNGGDATGGDPFGSTEAFGASVLGGFLSGGPIGALFNPALAAIGSGLRSATQSVICTALYEEKLLPEYYKDNGEAYIAKLPINLIMGYYSFGIPIYFKIRDGSKFWTTVSLPFAKSWVNAVNTGKWFKNPLALVTKLIGFPICYSIGTFLTWRAKWLQQRLA